MVAPTDFIRKGKQVEVLYNIDGRYKWCIGTVSEIASTFEGGVECDIKFMNEDETTSVTLHDDDFEEINCPDRDEYLNDEAWRFVDLDYSALVNAICCVQQELADFKSQLTCETETADDEETESKSSDTESEPFDTETDTQGERVATGVLYNMLVLLIFLTMCLSFFTLHNRVCSNPIHANNPICPSNLFPPNTV